MVLVSFVSSYLIMVRRIIVRLMTSDSKPRVHADVVVITLDNHFLFAAVSFVMSMTMVVVVVTRVGQRGSSTNINIVVVSFDNHNVVGVL